MSAYRKKNQAKFFSAKLLAAKFIATNIAANTLTIALL